MPYWYTTDQARAEWRGAPADDGVLSQLLEVAKIQVAAYASGGYSYPFPEFTVLPNGYIEISSAPDTPGGPPGGAIPVNYRQAQLMQARNLWNASKVDAGGQVGDDTFAIRPHPLDWVVKAVIRPKRGVPVVG